jgi:hypothetical protein
LQAEGPIQILLQSSKTAGWTPGARFRDFREWKYQQNLTTGVPDLEALPSGIAPLAQRFDPHFGGRLVGLEIGGFDIGQFQAIVIPV